MKKLMVAGVLVIVMLGLLSAVAFSAAGDPTQSVTVSAVVAKAVWLKVTDDVVSLAGSPGIDNSTDKLAEFEVRSNWNWTLQANALASLSGTDAGGAAATLPGASILVQGSAIDGNVVVATGSKTASQLVPANYLSNFQWTDSASGIATPYTGTHTYTLAFN
ncbi:MAG: hypothetical protein ACYC5Q_05395 [Thermoleophilia bacterium]